MSGYKDYMFLLRPDDNTCREIANMKCYATNFIGDYKSMRSTAHISIIKYSRQKPYVIEQLIDNLALHLKQMPVIKLNTHNFNFFIHKNDTYTIYAGLEASLASDNWFTALRKHFKLAKAQFVPHITIVRGMNSDKFLRLWPHLRFKTYKSQCTIYGLTILERETLNTQAKWNIYREVRFKDEARKILVDV